MIYNQLPPPPPSSNLTFGVFVENVTNSNPQIGRGFMGNVSFVSGLPNGLTKGMMTVISYGKGFIKFILDVESTPKHYECYRLSDGTITDWTTGQGGGGEGNVIVTADITNIDIENNRFYFENLSEEPATIWDLAVNQNKRVVIELSWTIKDEYNVKQLLNATFTIEGANGSKILVFENNNFVLFNGAGMMALEIGFLDGLWEDYGFIQYEENGGATELMTNVTWSDLKSLRDSGGLVPGMKYRIIDYECSTSQEYTQSANNMFDIIVTADDERTLNENARACKRDWVNFLIDSVTFERIDNAIIVKSNGWGGVDSETLPLNPDGYHSAEEGYDLYGAGSFFILVPNDIEDKNINCTNVYMADFNKVDPDYGVHSSGKLLLDYYMASPFVTYFDKSNLSAWELKYCLDNDTNRFAWAVEGQPGEYYHLVEIVGNDTKEYTFRTIDETEEYWMSYNINDPSVVGYIKPNLDPVTDSNFILYKDGHFEDEYSEPYGKTGNEATVKEITLVDNPGTPSGKGVIYYMKDEWGNECPYDFKNIMFYDYATSKYYYTFNVSGNDGTIYNSLNFRNNRIDKYFDKYDNKYSLNNIILVDKAINNTFANDCHDCKFDASESSCFGEGCNYITTNNVSVIRNLVFGNNVNNLRISSDDTFTGVSDGWIFDANTFIEGYSVEITLPDSLTLYDYTENKRVTKTTSDKIIAIQEYMDGSYTIKTDVTLLYPSGRSGTIYYNSNSEITGDWIDTNTDTTQNTYNPETGDGTLQLNEGVDVIGGEVTRQGLREMTINSPFYMNTDVRSVDMTNSGIVTIGVQAFNGCTNLSSVVIPNTVTKIDKGTFTDCPLNSVDIPDSVVFIDNLAFSTTTININYNGSTSGSSWGAQYVNAPTDKDSGLMFGKFDTNNYSCAVIGCIVKGKDDNVTIPGKYNDGKNDYSIIAILDYAFRNCTNISSITIPDSVTSIGRYIFDGCYTMKEKDKVSTIQSVTELSSSVPSTTKETFEDDITIPYLYVTTEDAVKPYTDVWGKYFKEILTQKKSPSEER